MSNSITKAKPVVHETDDKKEWFETWFDSPYYHILYKDRDHKEADIRFTSIKKVSKLPDTTFLKKVFHTTSNSKMTASNFICMICGKLFVPIIMIS